MEEKEKIARIEGWLRLIERTRLFCNTAEELGQLVGFSVGHRNSLARKGGNSLFMKEAIFQQMAYLCEQETGLNLREVIEAYADVDNFIDRYEARLNDKGLPAQLVALYYGNGEVDDDLSFVKRRLEERHIPILILMLLGCLPRLSAKYGDVEDIMGDFGRALAFLHEVCRVPTFTTIPLLTIHEEGLEEDPQKRTRLQLIATMKEVLEGYGTLSTQLRLSANTRELMKGQFIPDIDGIWTEDDETTAFWFLERLTNGYNMYHYELKDDQQTLRYTKFFVSFFNEEEAPMAIVVHPRMIRYMIEGKPVPANCFAYLDFAQEGEELHFSPTSKDGAWFGLSLLTRSRHERFYLSLLEDEGKTRVNEFAEDDYELRQMMVAITHDAIYLKRDDHSYYRVPKGLNKVLEDTHFGDNVGILSLADATFVAFDDKGLYYDVTTVAKQQELGIELVDKIED